MKKLTIQEFQDRLNIIYPREKLKALIWNGSDNMAKVQCENCGQIYEKIGLRFLDKRKISICKICFPTQPNQKKETFPLPDDYEYVEPYQGMAHKVLIRHKCGFVWAITPANIKLGKGCPKCNRKISKGELYITEWLLKNNIQFETQKPLILNNHHLFIDFYLPEQDLYIEYNGEQHYYPVKYFGGKNKFEAQRKNDILKREFLKEKLLEIPYSQFNNLANILESSTTISLESTQQAMAMEAEKLLAEYDIVSSSMETQSSSLENEQEVATPIEDF